MPQCRSFPSGGLWCGTTSKALEKSSTATSTCFFLSKIDIKSWTVDNNWESQLWPDLKPCWKIDNILWLSRWARTFVAVPLWLPKRPHQKRLSPFWSNGHTLRPVTKRPHYFDQNGQLWDTFTCVGRLICPEGHVSSLNKSNPIQTFYSMPKQSHSFGRKRQQVAGSQNANINTLFWSKPPHMRIIKTATHFCSQWWTGELYGLPPWDIRTWFDLIWLL